MSYLGIIANPDSGTDIRRITSSAVTESNHRKIRIVHQFINALGLWNIDRLEIMPDKTFIGIKSLEDLDDERLLSKCSIVDMEIQKDWRDTLNATRYFVKEKADLILVIGGDGTSRIVSKAAADTPLLSLSSGTNNVIPERISSTTAGTAAGFFLSLSGAERKKVCKQHKRLSVFRNGEEIDHALIDVTILDEEFSGSKAVWNPASIRQIFVSRAHPKNIGLSSIVGAVKIVSPDKDGGASLRIIENGKKIAAAIEPGRLRKLCISELEEMDAGVHYPLVDIRPLQIALDGEREHALYDGDEATIQLKTDGPWFLNIDGIMDLAIEKKAFYFD